jgi:hypothetical protein
MDVTKRQFHTVYEKVKEKFIKSVIGGGLKTKPSQSSQIG